MSSRPPLSDTDPEARRVQLDLYRKMSPAERLRCVDDLNRAANDLAMAGLRARHPEAGERELFLRLAVLRLGADLVERAYGWRNPDDA